MPGRIRAGSFRAQVKMKSSRGVRDGKRAARTSREPVSYALYLLYTQALVCLPNLRIDPIRAAAKKGRGEES